MTALFIIDVQKGYIEKYEDGLVSNINRRIQLAAENGELVVYIKNIRKLRSGSTAYDFADGLTVSSPHLILKEKASVFSDPGLLELLHQHSVTEIEIIGIDGSCCVASSAVDACKLGFHVTLPCEFIGVRNMTKFEERKKKLAKAGITIL